MSTKSELDPILLSFEPTSEDQLARLDPILRRFEPTSEDQLARSAKKKIK